MSLLHPRTDGRLDELLDQPLDAGVADSPVVDYLAAVRRTATSATPRPTDDLGVVLDQGLAQFGLANQTTLTSSTLPAERGILTASAGRGIVTGGILTVRSQSGAAPGRAQEAPGRSSTQVPGPGKPEASSPATTRGRAGD